MLLLEVFDFLFELFYSLVLLVARLTLFRCGINVLVACDSIDVNFTVCKEVLGEGWVLLGIIVLSRRLAVDAQCIWIEACVLSTIHKL